VSISEQSNRKSQQIMDLEKSTKNHSEMIKNLRTCKNKLNENKAVNKVLDQNVIIPSYIRASLNMSKNPGSNPFTEKYQSTRFKDMEQK